MIADASLDLALTWDTGNVSPYAKCLGLGYVLHAGAELQAPAIKHLAGLIETGLQEQAQGLAP